METTEVLKAVEKLADKLGTTAEQLFSYYVKNAKLYQIYYWIQIGVSVILFTIGLLLCSNTYQPIFDKSPAEAYTVMQLFGFIIGSGLTLIGIIGIIIQLFNIEELIRAIKNPEYEAIEDLFGSIFPNE